MTGPAVGAAPPADIDFLAPAGAKRTLLERFAALGYAGDERRNELQGHRRRDILTLLHHHELDAAAGIDAGHVARQCARDWRLWRTATLNLERVRAGVSRYAPAPEQEAVLIARLDALRREIDAAPKTTRWKLCARLGERVQWYEEPEEVG